MKKLCGIMLVCMILCALTSCVDFHPSDCPYGVWKCEDSGFNFTLDIDPQVDIIANESAKGYSKLTLYPGEYLIKDELIEVYVSVFDPKNQLGIFHVTKTAGEENEENRGSVTAFYTINGVIDVYTEDMIVLLSSYYRVVDGRLRLWLTKDYQEKLGIEYLYCDLVKEYEVPVHDD